MEEHFNLTRLKIKYALIFFSFITIPLSAQRASTIDELFEQFVKTSYFHAITDTLPNLFYDKDSTLLKVDELLKISSISAETDFPVHISSREWKLIDWNNIPRSSGTTSVQVSCDEKLFHKYEITISVPLLNPRGYKRKKGECCESTHYICARKYLIKEKKDEMIILEGYSYTYPKTVCILFL